MVNLLPTTTQNFNSCLAYVTPDAFDYACPYQIPFFVLPNNPTTIFPPHQMDVDCLSIILPTTTSAFCFLPKHIPLLSHLQS